MLLFAFVLVQVKVRLCCSCFSCVVNELQLHSIVLQNESLNNLFRLKELVLL